MALAPGSPPHIWVMVSTRSTRDYPDLQWI
jgi:hypothetical protein